MFQFVPDGWFCHKYEGYASIYNFKEEYNIDVEEQYPWYLGHMERPDAEVRIRKSFSSVNVM